MVADNTTNVRTISVVIASGAGGEFLLRCLDSLRDQVVDNPAVEVIVVDRVGEQRAARVERNYPFATVVRTDLDHRPSVPELRKLGAERATGDVVAVLEEHCVAPATWIETIQTEFRESDAAIGGPILDAEYDRIRDWVVYFSEYHNYLPPWSHGKRYMLNGANIAYDRRKLLNHRDVLGDGYWEVVLHPPLTEEGDFRSVPEMGVYHTGPFNYGYYLNQRYLLSRVWGGTERDKVSSLKRMLYLTAAPLLPPFLLARITQRVLPCEHLRPKFFRALPLLIPVTVAYAWGEWRGYLSGVGNALELVE